jgi:hypothetical protein
LHLPVQPSPERRRVKKVDIIRQGRVLNRPVNPVVRISYLKSEEMYSSIGAGSKS